MSTGQGSDDPKGLIAESFLIEGIGLAECRSIFLDWALTVPADGEERARIDRLLKRHGQDAGHPMVTVLTEGLTSYGAPRRRGGYAARARPET